MNQFGYENHFPLRSSFLRNLATSYVFVLLGAVNIAPRTVPSQTPLLKTIFAYVPKKELSEMLMETLSKNDVASAIKLYRSFKSDSVNAYVNTENLINSLGYRLIGMNRFNQAIEIFKLNVESYQQSANAYDSLAEAYM